MFLSDTFELISLEFNQLNMLKNNNKKNKKIKIYIYILELINRRFKYINKTNIIS